MMSKQTRIYGSVTTALNHQSIKQVFETVATKAKTPLSSCMLDMNNAYAEQRHQEECERLQRLFDMKSDTCVLDIGCGIGRLRLLFPESIYIGVDFCSAYIETACQQLQIVQHQVNKTMFLQHDITRLEEVNIPLNINLTLMCGICMYLTDDQVRNLFRYISRFKNCHFYLRESISILDKRLTLDEFPSEDLGLSYSAIYRTREEYVALIQEFFEMPTYSKLLQEKPLRSETNQIYFQWHS